MPTMTKQKGITRSLVATTTTIDTRRRSLFRKALSVAPFISTPIPSIAQAAEDVDDPRKIVRIRLQSPGTKLGIKLGNTNIGNRPVVVVLEQPVKYTRIQEGMILQNYKTMSDVLTRIQNGPYPIDFEFLNLAAGGDAYNDMGNTMVTPKDALQLNQKLATTTTTTTNNNNEQQGEFIIQTVSKPTSGNCAITSRKNDVLEIIYEAYYTIATSTIDDEDSNNNNNKKRILYDSSSKRGTGQPYQMVLGSGDMIRGVDLGLYDMCPGEARILKIPSAGGILSYGNNSLRTYNIPSNYIGLEWKIKLKSINSVIREDNNNRSREEMEGRAL